MSIHLSIEAVDAADLKRQLRELLGEPAPSVKSQITAVMAGAAATDQAKEATVTQPKVEPKPTPTVQQAAQTLAAEHPVETAKAEPLEGEVLDAAPKTSWDYATEIKPAVLKVSQSHGREGVLKLLEPFAVDNASKIPPERHAELMASINAMLAAA